MLRSLKRYGRNAVLGSTVSNTVADGYTAHYYEYPSYGMIMGINANATDEERAATYMFLDWMSQPENLALRARPTPLTPTALPPRFLTTAAMPS